MSRGLFRLILVTAFLALVAGTPVGAQAADEPETGVWWQLNTGNGLGVPPPPLIVDVPDGGLWLSSSPGGDQARSALRVPTPDGKVPETLTLRVNSDSSTPALAMALCAVAEPWTVPDESPGPWDDRAKPDCDTFTANGIVAFDGASIDFALSGFDPGEDLDLVLTRVPDDPSTYVNATFLPPEPEDLRVGSPVGTGGFVPPSTTTPPPQTAPNSVADFGSVPGVGGGFTPTFDAGGTGGDLTLPDDPGATPAAPNAPIADVGQDDELATAPAAFDEPSDAARWVAFVVLIVLLAWIAAIVSRRMMGGAGPELPRFTIYRGAPPAA